MEKLIFLGGPPGKEWGPMLDALGPVRVVDTSAWSPRHRLITKWLLDNPGDHPYCILDEDPDAIGSLPGVVMDPELSEAGAGKVLQILGEDWPDYDPGRPPKVSQGGTICKKEVRRRRQPR